MKYLHIVFIAFGFYLLSGFQFDIGFISILFGVAFMLAIKWDIDKEVSQLRARQLNHQGIKKHVKSFKR